jgi:isoleucyl-tRNA synthetase
MLGNLYDFSPQHEISYDSLTELDKYMLNQLYRFGNEVTVAYEELNFTRVCQTLIAFTNVELSAFYFDILKDRLYTSRANSKRRRSAQTVMFKILEIFTKSLAPILPHTAEEIYEHAKAIWNHLDGIEDNESIFQQGWMNVCNEWRNEELNSRWERVRGLKSQFNKLFETTKNLQNIQIATGLDVEVDLYVSKGSPFAQTVLKFLTAQDLTEVLIVSRVNVIELDNVSMDYVPFDQRSTALSEGDGPSYIIVLRKSQFHKCPRCWKRISLQPNQLCSSCYDVIRELS